MNLQQWLATELDYPMWIVTAADGSRRAGCLIGFASQCSIDPLRFAVFLSKKNFTYSVARDAEYLAVHAVPKDRRDLAELFGGETGDNVDKFKRCVWRAGPHGLPVIDGCTCWFTGSVVERLDAGDHMAFVLAPDEGAAEPGAVIGFDGVRDITPGHAP